jgi:alpha-tubulin suppressor-like RCC1 family protein
MNLGAFNFCRLCLVGVAGALCFAQQPVRAADNTQVNDIFAFAWGGNTWGELGDNTLQERHLPVLVVGLGRFQTLTAANSFSLALMTDGTVWTWGENTGCQLGIGIITIDSPYPVQVQNSDGTPFSGVTAIAGNSHSLALRDDGTVWAWGPNFYGHCCRLGE